RKEAVVGRGDDPQRRDTRALATLKAVAVLHAVGAAWVLGGFGYGQPLEGPSQPVHRIRRGEQILEDVVRNRLILKRVRAAPKSDSGGRERGCQGVGARRHTCAGYRRRSELGGICERRFGDAPEPSRGSGW